MIKKTAEGYYSAGNSPLKDTAHIKELKLQVATLNRENTNLGFLNKQLTSQFSKLERDYASLDKTQRQIQKCASCRCIDNRRPPTKLVTFTDWTGVLAEIAENGDFGPSQNEELIHSNSDAERRDDLMDEIEMLKDENRRLQFKIDRFRTNMDEKDAAELETFRRSRSCIDSGVKQREIEDLRNQVNDLMMKNLECEAKSSRKHNQSVFEVKKQLIRIEGELMAMKNEKQNLEEEIEQLRSQLLAKDELILKKDAQIASELTFPERSRSEMAVTRNSRSKFTSRSRSPFSGPRKSTNAYCPLCRNFGKNQETPAKLNSLNKDVNNDNNGEYLKRRLVETERDSLRHLYKNACEERDRLRGELIRNLAENSHSKEMNDWKGEKARLLANESLLKAHKTKLEQDLEKTEMAIISLTERNSSLEQRLQVRENIKSSQSLSSSRIRDWENQLSEANEKLMKSERERGECKTKVQRMTRKLDEEKSKVQELMANRKSEEEIAVEKAENTLLRSELDEKNGEIRKLRLHVQDLDCEYRKVLDRLVSQENALKKLQTNLDLEEEKFNQNKQQVDSRLEMENTTLRSELGQMKVSLKKYVDEINNYQRRLEEKEQERRKLLTQLEDH